MTVDPYAFMSPAAVAETGDHHPVLRTPMEHAHIAAGATVEEHDGWRISVYDTEAAGVWASDVSHLGKLDLRGSREELDEITGELTPGRAREDDGVWTLRLTWVHGYVLCPFPQVALLRERIGPAAIDVTCGLAGVAIGGPDWRELFARSSGMDVRERKLPAGCCAAGSVMRCHTLVLNEGPRVLMLVGWEFGEYFWESILDAGVNLSVTAVSPAVGARQEVSA